MRQNVPFSWKFAWQIALLLVVGVALFDTPHDPPPITVSSARFPCLLPFARLNHHLRTGALCLLSYLYTFLNHDEPARKWRCAIRTKSQPTYQEQLTQSLTSSRPFKVVGCEKSRRALVNRSPSASRISLFHLPLLTKSSHHFLTRFVANTEQAEASADYYSAVLPVPLSSTMGHAAPNEQPRARRLPPQPRPPPRPKE